jgi:hypothetical protein
MCINYAYISRENVLLSNQPTLSLSGDHNFLYFFPLPHGHGLFRPTFGTCTGCLGEKLLFWQRSLQTQYPSRFIGARNFTPVLPRNPDNALYELGVGFGQNAFGIVDIVFHTDANVASHNQGHHGHGQMTFADPDDRPGGILRNVPM